MKFPKSDYRLKKIRGNIKRGETLKLVTFYLSDHGVGHIARNIPIIKELLEIDEMLVIIYKCESTQGGIKSNFLGELRLRVEKESMDVGLGLSP